MPVLKDAGGVKSSPLRWAFSHTKFASPALTEPKPQPKPQNLTPKPSARNPLGDECMRLLILMQLRKMFCRWRRSQTSTIIHVNAIGPDAL